MKTYRIELRFDCDADDDEAIKRIAHEAATTIGSRSAFGFPQVDVTAIFNEDWEEI